MSMETDLKTQLFGHAGLTALVGTRIRPVLAPGKLEAPYCVYMVVSQVRQYSHDGYGNLDRYRAQISCFTQDKDGSSGYGQAAAVAAQVIAAMEAWPAANVRVQACFLEDRGDLYEEETGYYHIPLDFIVWYG